MKLMTSDLKNKKILFYILVIFGIIIRLIPLLTKGTSDVDEMISWIERIEVNGWSGGYSGIYFPASYILFYLVYQLAKFTSADVFMIFSFFRFGFELIFLAALLIASRYKFINKRLLLMLWLNPLFIILSFAGYTDIFSISMWFLFLFLLYMSERNKTNNLNTLIWMSAVFAIFAFLKPQTIYLALLAMFFLVLYYFINRKNFKLIVAILLGFLVAFLLFGKLLNPVTILSCGEKFGPTTISSFTTPPEVFWDKCLEKEQVLERYPKTGPQKCIDALNEAYAPIGEAGYCVKTFRYTDSFVKEVFIVPGLNKLTKQVIGTSDVMPSYSANMPNVWALYVKNADFYDPSKAVWRYYASKDLNNSVILANIILIFIVTIYLFIANRKANLSTLLIFIGLPITIIVPNFATMAHENHFALGSLIAGLSIGILSKSNYLQSKLTISLYLIWMTLNVLFAVNITQLYVADIWISQSANQTLVSVGLFIKESINPLIDIYETSYVTSSLAVVFLILLAVAFYQKQQKDKVSG
jgi:hypothetical protein